MRWIWDWLGGHDCDHVFVYQLGWAVNSFCWSCDLCIRSPTQVLVEDVNLDVEACKVTALVGPSGAGKSLTARACMCVLDVLQAFIRVH